MATRRHRGKPEDPYMPLPLTPENRAAAKSLMAAQPEMYALNHAPVVAQLAAYLGDLAEQLGQLGGKKGLPDYLKASVARARADAIALRNGAKKIVRDMGMSEAQVDKATKPRPRPRAKR